jgi:hypothetical protein
MPGMPTKALEFAVQAGRKFPELVNINTREKQEASRRSCTVHPMYPVTVPALSSWRGTYKK